MEGDLDVVETLYFSAENFSFFSLPSTTGCVIILVHTFKLIRKIYEGALSSSLTIPASASLGDLFHVVIL